MYIHRQQKRELVARAKRYLARQLHARVALSEVAGAVGVTPAYLTETFRNLEGVSLYRYELRLRLRHAAELLPSYDDLSRLALDLGFGSHSHFSAAFRRSFGCTPAAYRARMRENLASDRGSDVAP